MSVRMKPPAVPNRRALMFIATIADLAEHLTHRDKQPSARLGEENSPVSSFEKGNSQIFLKQAYLLADGAMRNEQFIAGAPEIQMTCSGFKGSQCG